MEQRRAEEEATGKKKRGRKPKVVEPLPTEEAKANTTDPDSRIMKTRQGYVQGYNAQAVVSEEQIIVAVGVTQEANDVQQLEPMLQTMAHTLEAAGIEDRPNAGLADAGYWSEANIRACSWPDMPELLIATTKDWKQRKMLREKGCPRGRILAFWWEPEPVVLAHIMRCGDSILATSIGVTHVRLLSLLRTMVVLQRDPETLAGHQQEYERGHTKGTVPQRGTLS